MAKVDKDFVAGVIHGKEAYDKSGGKVKPGIGGFLSEMVSPTYNPKPDTPSGREGYKTGWDGAKKADRGY